LFGFAVLSDEAKYNIIQKTCTFLTFKKDFQLVFKSEKSSFSFSTIFRNKQPLCGPTRPPVWFTGWCSCCDTSLAWFFNDAATMVAVAAMFAAAATNATAVAASSLSHAVTVEAKREKERKAFRPSLLPPAFTTPRTG
jgi:hypothetical protein